jgi:uncharacterized membrane protein YeaQ/YmgE (transglycosylase-associated protein family)
MEASRRQQEACGPRVTRVEAFEMNLENLVVLVLIAAVCGFTAERMTQGRLPYGLVGAIFAALLGSWLLVMMFHWRIPGDMTAGGVPVLTAILGAAAIIFVLSVASRSKALPGQDRKRS